MIKNYLTTAYRNLLRHKGASLIKVAGLSMGMCCCMLILVYLTDELSYNKFNAHYNEIYRVNYIKDGDGQFRKSAGTPSPGGPAIANDIPQVAAVARLYTRGGILATRGGPDLKRFQEANINFADNSLFKIFSVRWKEGNPADEIGRASCRERV